MSRPMRTWQDKATTWINVGPAMAESGGWGAPIPSGYWTDGSPFGNTGTGTDLTLTLDRVYYTPVWLVGDSIDGLGIDLNVGEAGKSMYLGLYSDSGGSPNTRLATTSAIALDAAGNKSETGLSLGPYYGRYWAALLSNATGTAQVEIRSSTTLLRTVRSSAINSTGSICYIEAGSYASGLPATATPTVSGINPPRIMLQEGP